MPDKSFIRNLILIFITLGGISFSLLGEAENSCVTQLLDFSISKTSPKISIADEVTEDLQTFSLVVPAMGDVADLSRWGLSALNKWLKNPLIDTTEIKRRQDSVKFLAVLLKKNPHPFKRFHENLDAVWRQKDLNMSGVMALSLGPALFTGAMGALSAFAKDGRQLRLVAFQMGMFAASAAGRMNRGIRHKLSPDQITFEDNQPIIESLSDAEAPQWIQEWAQKLQNTEKNDLQKYKRSIEYFLSLSKSRSQNIAATILDFSMLSSFTLLHPVLKLRSVEEKLNLFYQALGEFEVLLWFAEILNARKGLNFPEFFDADNAQLDIVEGHDPYVFYANEKSRPSTVKLDTDGVKLLFTTGPNGRGKSITLSMIPSLLQWAMIGAPVPVQSMRATPMRILTSLDIRGDKSAGRSHFQSQANRSGQIFKWLDESEIPALVVVDEFYRGTTFLEHLSAERATLEDLRDRPKTLTVAASHLRNLVPVIETWPNARNIHLSDSDEPERKYRVEPGPSGRVNAVEEMEAGKVPDRILKRMKNLMETTNIRVENP